MTIRPLQPHEHERWIELRRALWPEHAAAEIREEAKRYGRGPLRESVIVADAGDGKLVGFVEVSVRPDGRGSHSTPIGYVEGWYVEPAHRRQGVGLALLAAGEEWARSHGCEAMGSDRDWDNEVSRAAHLALGYRPTEPCEVFYKPLKDAAGDLRDAPRDYVGIVPWEPDVGTLVAHVSDPAAGGLAVFLGTTRAERNADGRDLIALDYEAYIDMAEKQLRDLAAEARKRWPVVKSAIVHQVGRVPLGKPSIVIAVSCPHRGEAFEACRWIIGTLKKDVAIWKKEVWSDGSGTWVHP
jgi:molybdopterin synthase catalytic subunit